MASSGISILEVYLNTISKQMNKDIVKSLLVHTEIMCGLLSEMLKEIDVDVNRCGSNGLKKHQPEEVVEYIRQLFNIDVSSKSRKAEISEARHLTCYLLKHFTSASLTRIAELTGNTNHSTAINSIKSVQKKIDQDIDNKKYIEGLIEGMNEHLNKHSKTLKINLKQYGRNINATHRKRTVLQ